jgi:hypothetical protein
MPRRDVSIYNPTNPNVEPGSLSKWFCEFSDERLCGREARHGTVLRRGAEVESTIALAWLADARRIVVAGTEEAPEPAAVRTRHEKDGDVVRCVVSGNASAGRTSAETEVKRKYRTRNWAGLQGGVV